MQQLIAHYFSCSRSRKLLYASSAWRDFTNASDHLKTTAFIHRAVSEMVKWFLRHRSGRLLRILYLSWWALVYKKILACPDHILWVL